MPFELPNQIDNPLVLGSIVGIALVLLVLLFVLHRHRSRQPVTRLRAAAADLLDHFLVPDGEDGEIHVDYAVLMQDAVLIVDLREVSGHVFGSNAMQDWTVIGDRRRYTFSNPQPALYDRVAAVSRLLPKVTVTGLVVFAPQANFSKGLPDNVMMLDDLVDRLHGERRELAGVGRSAELTEAWETLRRAAVEAQVGHLIRS